LPYKGWESLPIGEECIKEWASDLNPSTAKNYAYYLLRYLRWARGKGYWPSARAMLAEYGALEPKERPKHLGILKEYIKSLGTGTRDRRVTWSAVKSFYDYHRLPLPSPSRSEASRLFAPSEKDKRRAVELSPLRLEDVRQLILNAQQPYKAAIMVLLQSAMGLAEFTQFNLLGWKRAIQDLDEPGPLRIDLYREKASRQEVRRYYTFLGEDAKGLIRDWLAMRPEVDVDALFVVYNKNGRRWVPLRGRLLADMITAVAKRIGLIKPNGLDRYPIHAHEFRDLFKSICTLRGVNPVASEFFLGHAIDKMGYDKSPQYDQEWFRREYCKVEPQLNLLSNPSGAGMEARMEQVRREAALEAIRRFAEALGIDPMRVRIERQEELGRELDVEEEIQAIQGEIKRSRSGNGDPKRIVGEGELERYLAEGWDVQTVLPSGRVLVRRAHV
jgi:integrase